MITRSLVIREVEVPSAKAAQYTRPERGAVAKLTSRATVVLVTVGVIAVITGGLGSKVGAAVV